MDVVEAALRRKGLETATPKLNRWRAEMPTEREMRPRDKYTMFDRKEKTYRKGIHSRSHASDRPKKPICSDMINERLMCIELPKWTRVSQRLNPPGF